MIAMFYFCHPKSPLNIMKNVFNSITICSWKKIFLVNKPKSKCVIRKNLYFFDILKNGLILPLKACHFQYGQTPF